MKQTNKQISRLRYSKINVHFYILYLAEKCAYRKGSRVLVETRTVGFVYYSLIKIQLNTLPTVNCALYYHSN